MALVRLESLGHKSWDALGAGLSLLCVVHCAATPLVIAYLPLLGLEWLAREGFHRWFALAAIGVGGLSFVPGYLRHRRTAVPLLGSAGLLLLCYAAFAAHCSCCDGVAADRTAAAQMAVAPPAHCRDECCHPDLVARVGRHDDRPSAIAALGGLPWTSLGGLLLMLAHGLNCRWSRCCENGSCRPMPPDGSSR